MIIMLPRLMGGSYQDSGGALPPPPLPPTELRITAGFDEIDVLPTGAVVGRMTVTRSGGPAEALPSVLWRIEPADTLPCSGADFTGGQLPSGVLNFGPGAGTATAEIVFAAASPPATARQGVFVLEAPVDAVLRAPSSRAFRIKAKEIVVVGGGDEDLPFEGLWIGNPGPSHTANAPLKVGGNGNVGLGGKRWVDNEILVRFRAPASGPLTQAWFGMRAGDPSRQKDGKPADLCDDGYEGLYCKGGGEYAIGEGPTLVCDLYRHRAGAALTLPVLDTLIATSAKVEKPCKYMLDHSPQREGLPFTFRTPPKLTRGGIYYLLIRPDPKGQRDYVSFNMSNMGAEPPYSDQYRLGPYCRNDWGCWTRIDGGAWVYVTSSYSSSIKPGLPRFQLRITGHAKEFFGPSTIYGNVKEFPIGAGDVVRQVCRAPRAGRVRKVWACANGSSALTVTVRRANGSSAGVVMIPGNQFAAVDDSPRFLWGRADLPVAISVAKDEQLFIDAAPTSSAMTFYAAYSDRWPSLLSHAGISSPAAKMRDHLGEAGCSVRKSTNGGSSFANVAMDAVGLALEYLP